MEGAPGGPARITDPGASQGLEMTERLREIGQRLRTEEARFIDYPTIEEKSGALGFPTSVRTLRFYVAEGVLPPPRKVGKTPVYEEGWIMPALLAIHLMKTRLHRSLGEIRTILENLAVHPDELVESCNALHEEGADGSRWTRAEHRWLVDRFFGELTGTAAPGGRPRQLDEIRITDLERELRERCPPVASPPAGVPEPGSIAERLAPPAGFGFRYGPRSGPVRGTDVGSGSAPVPAGAMTPAIAKEMEDTFIRGFERGFRALRSIRHPVTGRRRATRASARDPLISDEYLRVADVLKTCGRFDRDIFDRLPLDKATVYRIGRGSAPPLVVAGVARSPIETFVRQGWSDARAGARDLDALIARFIPAPPAFAIIGVVSTTGWDPSLRERPPRGENWRLALAERGSDGGWSVWHDLDGPLRALAALYDPEPEEEKVERCAGRLLALPALMPRGALLDLEDIGRALGIDGTVSRKAVARAIDRDSTLRLVEIDGRQAVKRIRFQDGSPR